MKSQVAPRRLGSHKGRGSALGTVCQLGTAPACLCSMARLERLAAHVIGSGSPRTTSATRPNPSAAAGVGADAADDAAELARLFGPLARAEGPLMASGGGRRFTGVDLVRPLSPAQAAYLVDALAKHRLICLAGQDVTGGTFSLRHFERFANHYGAVVPHPNNFSTGSAGDFADADGAVELAPVADRRGAHARIPGHIDLPHDSPAVLTVANFSAASTEKLPPAAGAGAGFHTDIEYEPVPIAVSMFLVHAAPQARTAPGGTWVADTGEGDTAARAQRFFRNDRSPTAEGQRLRHSMKPLNGETAFIDLTAAFAALPPEARAERPRLGHHVLCTAYHLPSAEHRPAHHLT